MASPHSLMIKYGLPGAPSKDAIRLWEVRTREYIRNGIDAEKAGRKAASETFAGFETYFYASEADTIEMLLSQLDDD